jgi:hypothetical protein
MNVFLLVKLPGIEVWGLVEKGQMYVRGTSLFIVISICNRNLGNSTNLVLSHVNEMD